MGIIMLRSPRHNTLAHVVVWVCVGICVGSPCHNTLTHMMVWVDGWYFVCLGSPLHNTLVHVVVWVSVCVLRLTRHNTLTHIACVPSTASETPALDIATMRC